MRYCLFAAKEWLIQSYGLRPDLRDPITADKMPRVMHSGLTNWPRALGGVYSMTQTFEQLAQYDVVHVNVPPSGIKSVLKLRRLIDAMPDDQRPLLVANPDQAIEMWESFSRFDLFLESMSAADRVFCVHSVMAHTLQALLGKPVWTLPHPTDVETIHDEFYSVEKYPAPLVLVVAHAYDQNYLIVTEALRALRRDIPDLKCVLVGRMQKDPITVGALYDEVYEAMPFDALMKLMAMSTCVIDTAFTHSYGRIGVESAALGVPCIGNTSVESIAKLHRYAIDIYNADEIIDAVKACCHGSGAIVSPEYYNYEHSARAFEVMCNGQA